MNLSYPLSKEGLGKIVTMGISIDRAWIGFSNGGIDRKEAFGHER
jgi:hypothetical protein